MYYLKYPVSGIAEVYLHHWVDARERNLPSSPALHRKLRTTCRMLRSLGAMNAVARPSAELLSGKLAWAEGKRRKACRLWRRSAAIADQLGMACEQRLAQDELERHRERRSH